MKVTIFLIVALFIGGVLSVPTADAVNVMLAPEFNDKHHPIYNLQDVNLDALPNGILTLKPIGGLAIIGKSVDANVVVGDFDSDSMFVKNYILKMDLSDYNPDEDLFIHVTYDERQSHWDHIKERRAIITNFADDFNGFMTYSDVKEYDRSNAEKTNFDFNSVKIHPMKNDYNWNEKKMRIKSCTVTSYSGVVVESNLCMTWKKWGSFTVRADLTPSQKINPSFVINGTCDIGIVGTDKVETSDWTLYYNSDVEVCDTDETYDATINECVDTASTCETDETYDATINECVDVASTCETDETYDATINECVDTSSTCDTDETYDATNNECVDTSSTCDTDETYDATINECVLEVVDETGFEMISIDYNWHDTNFFFKIDDYSSDDLSNTTIGLSPVTSGGDAIGIASLDSIYQQNGEDTDYKEIWLDSGIVYMSFEDYDEGSRLKLRITVIDDSGDTLKLYLLNY